MKQVVRTQTYQDDLNAIELASPWTTPVQASICGFSLMIRWNRWGMRIFRADLGVHDTLELVAHPNYVVIMEENATTVTVLNVVHVRQKWP